MTASLNCNWIIESVCQNGFPIQLLCLFLFFFFAAAGTSGNTTTSHEAVHESSSDLEVSVAESAPAPKSMMFFIVSS